MSSKIILVLGATGAQGIAVVEALLAPGADGSPSPYKVRALTRDPTSERAKKLTAQGVECVKGAFNDLASVEAAFEGVYGAWVNTDGFTIGEEKETYVALKIYEIAKREKSVRHYVWSNLDYVSKKGGYEQQYKAEHIDAKGRIGDFLKSQPSVISDTELSWTSVTTGAYFEMLNLRMFGPLNVRDDGTYVFASSIADGHVNMISLADIGFWARYTFDHREDTSGKDLEVGGDWVNWDYLVETFKQVTGKKAVYVRQSMDEWWGNFNGVDKPSTYEKRDDPTATSIRTNFSAFWACMRNDIFKRDWEWINSVHPNRHTLEKWMRETNYDGEIKRVLKGFEPGSTASIY